MNFKDSVTIPCDRATVWSALNDPGVLRQCIPGCEELEQQTADHMTAKVSLKIGPIKARFTGAVDLTDIKPPESYVLSGEGKGGIAGFAKGSAHVRLEETGPLETVLHYEAAADVGGKVAQLGSRLLDSTAKKLARQFFDDFQAVVTASKAEPQ
ncbi:CoxG family protein [Pseudohoeflea coraliihabitans]|uniref:Carbon monoxide dehydrogenase subunit G n=1 Tax=Pseudohoeflea coraliihabitans TaxID=2860393 RepID=A0ABS6WN88_9HYPH|nr:carbon monoxide dehydrogenase subunit G [Pseudohoeflea sp. DP4N28-3]MBW3097416.1 carbon monoxide dehydrogenase subunit G [Pseudohoeflea sp. DP4N28-3]